MGNRATMEEKETTQDSQPKLKYFRPISKIILIIFVMGSFFLFVSTIMLIILTKPEKEVKVPDVIGQQFSDIYNGLARTGIKAEVKFRETFDVEDGIIMEQYPESGTIIPEGNSLKLTISRSGYILEVPSLVGKSLPVAKNSLRNLHHRGRTFMISTGVVSYIPSDKTAENIVIAQSPVPGELVRPDRRMNLLISAGPATDDRIMPNLKDQSVDLAFDLLSAKKLRVTQTFIETWDKSASGLVVEQTPPAGSQLANNAVVSIKIAIYPMKGHPYYGYEKIDYTIPSSYTEGLFEALVEDDAQKRICFAFTQRGGQQISFAFHRTGKAKISILRDKAVVSVIGVSVEDF